MLLLETFKIYLIDAVEDTNKLATNDVKRLLTNCVYLEDSWIELYGYKIYGSPWCPAEPNSGDGFG